MLEASPDSPSEPQTLFERWGATLTRLYCFSAALSIGLAQLAIYPLLLLWILHLIQKPQERKLTAPEFIIPLVLWVVTSVVAAIVGVDPLKGLEELLKNGILLLVPFAVCTLLQRASSLSILFKEHLVPMLMYLILGHGVASLHTVIATATNFVSKPTFPGPVTESGQLALTLPVIFSVVLIGFRYRPNLNRFLPLVAALSVSLMLIVWPNIICAAEWCRGVAILFSILLLGVLFQSRRTVPEWELRLGMSAFALLLAAFIINLKRGPWFAVFFVALILGMLESRRLALAALGVTAIVFATVTPVRDRALHFADDFSIAGGRKSMWTLGGELIQRYPLGIGTSNVNYMREIDPTLPQTHRHMHSNLINVAVESGLLGLGAYITWIVAAVMIPFRGYRSYRKVAERESQIAAALCLGISLSLISWQLAGLVEYNFGDREVRLLVFLFMGIGLALGERSRLDGEQKDQYQNVLER